MRSRTAIVLFLLVPYILSISHLVLSVFSNREYISSDNRSLMLSMYSSISFAFCFVCNSFNNEMPSTLVTLF